MLLTYTSRANRSDMDMSLCLPTSVDYMRIREIVLAIGFGFASLLYCHEQLAVLFRDVIAILTGQPTVPSGRRQYYIAIATNVYVDPTVLLRD